MWVQNPGAHEVMIMNSVGRTWGSCFGGLGSESDQAQALSVMFSVTTSQLLGAWLLVHTERRFLRGLVLSAEMPPGRSVGAQQEADGTHTRMIWGVERCEEP